MCLVHDHYCEVCGEKSLRTLSERCENYDNGIGCLGHEVGVKKYTNRCNSCNPGTVFYSGKNPSVPIVAGRAAQVNRDFDYLGASAPRPADWPCCPRDPPFKSKPAPYEKSSRPLSEEMRKLGRTLKEKILSPDKKMDMPRRGQVRISLPLEREHIAAMRSPAATATAPPPPPPPPPTDMRPRHHKHSTLGNGVHHGDTNNKSCMQEPGVTSAPARATNQTELQRRVQLQRRPANAASNPYRPHNISSPESPPIQTLKFGMKPPPTRMPPLPGDSLPVTRDNLRRMLDRLDKNFSDARESYADYNYRVAKPALHPATGIAGSALPSAQNMARDEYEPGRFNNQLDGFLSSSTDRARSRRRRAQRDTYVANAELAGLPGFYGRDVNPAHGSAAGSSDGNDKARGRAAHNHQQQQQQYRPRRGPDAYKGDDGLAGWLGQHEVTAEMVQSPEREVQVSPGYEVSKPMRCEVRKYVKTPPRQSPRSARSGGSRSAHRSAHRTTHRSTRRQGPYY